MRKINEISSKILKELYWYRKISSPKIAEIYRCDSTTIRRLLRKHGIRIRSKSEAKRLLFNIELSKRELRNLYLKRKLSSPVIAKKFNCSPAFVRNKLREYDIPVRSLQEALPLSNKPHYQRYDFSKNMEEKAYLIGFRSGDLYASRLSQETIYVSMNSTKRAQHNIFKSLFSKYGHVWEGQPNRIKVVSTGCRLNNTFGFLLDKKDLINSWILKRPNCFAAFLAGYSDAEGTFCLCKGKGVFSIRSQDKNILRQIRSKLIKLEIFLRPPQIVRRKGTRDIRGTISNKDIWGIFIHRKDSLIKLINFLDPYLKHADKRKRTKIVKSNILERNKKYNRRQSSKWDKLYLNEGVKLCQDIAIGNL